MMDYTKTIATKEKAYSFHTFLFPFEWEYRNGQDSLLEDKTNMANLQLAMNDGPGNWERRPSWNPPRTVAQFNEVAYFYDFVRPVLYDSGKKDSLQLHYFRSLSEYDQPIYRIRLPHREYRLEIDDISVSYYDTGVGVLAFHLINREQEQSAPDDILTINTFGRRIYPPFLSTRADLITTQAFYDYAGWDKALDGTKNDAKELPLSIDILDGETVLFSDAYMSWTVNQNLDREPGLIRDILPPKLFSFISMTPVLDDRMFVVCWYGNQDMVKELQGKDASKNFKTHDWWYQFAFVDKAGPWGKTCQNDLMATKLIKGVTNARWAKAGTFYAVSRYSFVALTGEMSAHHMNGLILSHTQTIYQKIALLGLVQRASLLRFSKEITAISELKRGDKRIAQRVGSLYQQYIRFVNRVYFREVTAQEQGIELYDILQREMRLDAQVTALEQEMQELHQYVLILDEDKRNEKLDLLTYFAALFVVPGFIGTYYGIGDFKMHDYWWAISLMCAISAGLALTIVRSEGRWRTVWIVVTVLFSAFVVFGFPFFVESFKAATTL
jgi:hypothetical protein